MQQPATRRDFLLSTALAAGAAALGPAQLFAIEPFKRAGRARFHLSLAAYSFRDYFKDGGKKENAEGSKRIDLFDFVDFCAEHNCAAELTAYYFPPDVTDEFLLKLKRHAFLRGVPISGSAVGNVFTHPIGPKRDEQLAYVKQWIDRAAVLSAPHLRIFAGNTQGTSKEEAKRICLKAIEECCDHAAKRGVVLGLENHGGIVAEAEDLLDIVRRVKSPWFGVNLDTGNFHTDDPYKDLEACAPYAVNVQFKAQIRRRGAESAEAGDIRRVVKILRDANYQGYFALEYESAEDPWKAAPRLLNEMREAIA